MVASNGWFAPIVVTNVWDIAECLVPAVVVADDAAYLQSSPGSRAPNGPAHKGHGRCAEPQPVCHNDHERHAAGVPRDLPECDGDPDSWPPRRSVCSGGDAPSVTMAAAYTEALH